MNTKTATAAKPSEAAVKPTAPAPGTAVTSTSTGNAPAELQDMIAADAGRGVSTAQEDNLVPLIYVLQPLSPQVDKRNPAYIEGAEPGDIWLRNAPHPIIKGEVGVEVQPCFFSKSILEWVPRDDGGGFVARHKEMPKEAKSEVDPDDQNLVNWYMPSGNELIETREHVVRVFTPEGVLAYVLPFSSTGHSVSRSWMFMMNNKTSKGVRAPSFAGRYRLKTKQRKNKKGTWFMLDVADLGWVQSVEDYAEGKKLADAFEQGAKAAEAPVNAGPAEKGADAEAAKAAGI